MARFVSTAFVNHKFHNAARARALEPARLFSSQVLSFELEVQRVLWVLWDALGALGALGTRTRRTMQVARRFAYVYC